MHQLFLFQLFVLPRISRLLRCLLLFSCLQSELFIIRVITELEKLGKFEIALVVHERLFLCEHDDNQDQGVEYEHQAVNIKPELHLFLICDDSEAVDVDSHGWQVEEQSLKHRQTAD